MAQKPICKIAIQGYLQLIELFNFSLCIINLGFIYLIAGLRRRRSIQVGNQSLGIGECSYLSLDKPQGKGLYILLFDRFLGTNGGIVILMESAIIVITAIRFTAQVHTATTFSATKNSFEHTSSFTLGIVDSRKALFTLPSREDALNLIKKLFGNNGFMHTFIDNPFLFGRFNCSLCPPLAQLASVLSGHNPTKIDRIDKNFLDRLQIPDGIFELLRLPQTNIVQIASGTGHPLLIQSFRYEVESMILCHHTENGKDDWSRLRIRK